MDPIVEAALRKWPNVPHCFGWLALDARGDWYMRDERVQAAGLFPRVKGSRIEHAKLLDFIGRNYAADAAGAWFFQNGPQRVYVELEAAPWVWRVSTPAGAGPTQVATHTGAAVDAVTATWLDEDGRLYLETERGFGIVHTLDMEPAADAVERGEWQPASLRRAELAPRFGYRLSPAAGAAQLP